MRICAYLCGKCRHMWKQERPIDAPIYPVQPAVCPECKAVCFSAPTNNTIRSKSKAG